MGVGIGINAIGIFLARLSTMCSHESIIFLTEIRDFCYKDSNPERKGKKSILFVRVG